MLFDRIVTVNIDAVGNAHPTFDLADEIVYLTCMRAIALQD